jgi:5-oxoprolinase (ATP-hydrolysing)
MEGGNPGMMGKNTWVKKLREDDGDLDANNETGARDINIGGKGTVFMGKGDRLLIETPGAGAWGAAEDGSGGKKDAVHVRAWEPRGSFAERASAQAAF